MQKYSKYILIALIIALFLAMAIQFGLNKKSIEETIVKQEKLDITSEKKELYMDLPENSDVVSVSSEEQTKIEANKNDSIIAPKPAKESVSPNKAEKLPLLVLDDQEIDDVQDLENVQNVDDVQSTEPEQVKSPEPIIEEPEDIEEASPEKYYRYVMTTIFWVGERANRSNDYIANKQSFWDSNWQKSYGGVDDPNKRCGYFPCKFDPKENPFYFALPYADLDDDGNIKENAKRIPWYSDRAQDDSIIKNTWIEVVYKDKSCYGQWEDVGPNELDDFDYVFGSGKPINSFGVLAGLDISPALRDCLELTTNEITAWRFVDEQEVPSGPWKNIVTRSGLNY